MGKFESRRINLENQGSALARAALFGQCDMRDPAIQAHFDRIDAEERENDLAEAYDSLKDQNEKLIKQRDVFKEKLYWVRVLTRYIDLLVNDRDRRPKKKFEDQFNQLIELMDRVMAVKTLDEVDKIKEGMREFYLYQLPYPAPKRRMSV